MIDIIGIFLLFLVGFILFVVGSNIPDQTDIILQNKDKIVNLGTERWNCGNDVQCQKAKTNSINAINLSLSSIETSQNLRSGFMWIGGLMDVFAIVGVVAKARS